MVFPYLGEIRIFAGDFAPAGWAFCHGQLLPISGNDALFSIIGTMYGGDGQNDFALPDFRGRLPVHSGSSTGPGLTGRTIAEAAGSEQATLSLLQMPAHTHTLAVSTASGDAATPQNNFPAELADPDTGDPSPRFATTASVTNSSALGNTGGGQPFSIMKPYLCVNFIIALDGIYPTPS